MNIRQIAHAGGKILRRSLLGDLHMPPRLVRIEEHEQISGAVALVFVIISLRLTRPGVQTGDKPGGRSETYLTLPVLRSRWRRSTSATGNRAKNTRQTASAAVGRK